ncbi:aminoglycoside phosphotransferase family protein [Gryllotalpicola protaetiae]|uniref:aminoglycoside phosphotransferase family protein n=1 Tax=Gryllotalpicola protaetiae TaxID=2419771 RepID=UPI0013C4C556|nr:aminoglycoside phosphotransferase family protein [Gryllotalpicola protaetiae]
MSATASYLEAWGLTADAEPVVTPTSEVTFVHRADGTAAVLRVAPIPEELRGGALMAWWPGTASARVLEHLGPAVLLERAEGPRSLAALAAEGDAGDDEATRVLAETALRLHAKPDGVVRTVPLRRWFSDLLEASDDSYADARRTALRLLDDPWDEVVLHGDIHHGNVLDFGDERTPRWKAIDPKALLGESCFDYANLLCNPHETYEANHESSRLTRRLAVVASATGMPADRLRDWHTAWHALSQLWS